MNIEELRKLLKENGVVAYTYWGKDKLIDLAKINKLIPEPEPEPEEPKEPETPKKNKLAAIEKYKEFTGKR